MYDPPKNNPINLRQSSFTSAPNKNSNNPKIPPKSTRKNQQSTCEQKIKSNLYFQTSFNRFNRNSPPGHLMYQIDKQF